MAESFEGFFTDVDAPRLRLSLRISGDMLDPEFLSLRLGMAPSFSAARGDLDPRSGEPREAGIWVYRADPPGGTELGEGIESLLARLPEDSTLWEEVTSAYRVEVFCGVFLRRDNQSTMIDPDVLGALHRRGFGLHLDLYAPVGDVGDGDG